MRISGDIYIQSEKKKNGQRDVNVVDTARGK